MFFPLLVLLVLLFFFYRDISHLALIKRLTPDLETAYYDRELRNTLSSIGVEKLSEAYSLVLAAGLRRLQLHGVVAADDLSAVAAGLTPSPSSLRTRPLQWARSRAQAALLI